jgi:small subunit ribosomal protein S9
MTTKTKEKYFEAVGRRKTAVARVRLFSATKGHLTVNDLPIKDYFRTTTLQNLVKRPLVSQKLDGAFTITAHIKGGGIHAQAEAMSHGIARAILLKDASLKPSLKKDGLLTRDPRSKERRKFGLKKARKSPQWSKR